MTELTLMTLGSTENEIVSSHVPDSDKIDLTVTTGTGSATWKLKLRIGTWNGIPRIEGVRVEDGVSVG